MLKKFFRKHKSLIWRLFVLFICLGLFGAGLLVLWASNLKIPDFTSFETRQVEQSTKIYDRTGQVLLYNFGENLRRTVVPGDKISRNVKNATVAIEDWDFYNHHGIRPTSIIRAFIANITHIGTTQGGSTITQQVIKNSLLTQEKSISRKIKEAFLALKLERVMSKDDILTHYLNESPYGGNVYGIEEASQTFFGKSASDLDLAESAYLAALPNAPTYFSPYGNHKDALEVRKNLVLNRMQELKFATVEEVEKAKSESVSFLPAQNFGIKAPHFVFYVRQYLENKYGEQAVVGGGLKIISTLDWEMQKEAEEIVGQFAPINEKNFNAHNIGVIATDPRTGKILIMIGSRDYFEEGSGNFNVTLAHRQPGSSFKPFVYATAFKKGYTPDTVVFDLPTQFQTTCSPIVPSTPELLAAQNKANPDCYAPVNYDSKFRGPMTLRSALAQSINIPAIKVLYLAGIKNSIATARDLGISSLGTANQYGLTLVLGGGEVSLLELTNAYGVFANHGLYNAPTAIERIEDAGGNVLEQAVPSNERVLDESVSSLISNVLSDNVARAPSYGSDSPLSFTDRDVAAKTGTTNDYRDMWVIGYSPELALGAWVGNNDNSSMEKKVAGFVVAPMWRKIFDAIGSELPKTPFPEPDLAYLTDHSVKPVLRGFWQGNETYVIDKLSGKLASQYTPLDMQEEVPVMNVHEILNWVDKNDPRGPVPINPASDPQYVYWEAPVKVWALTNGYLTSSSTKPTLIDDTHSPTLAPRVSITIPNENSNFKISDRIDVRWVISSSSFPIESAELYLNGTYIGSTKSPITNYSFIPNSSTQVGNSELRVVVYDSKRNKSEAITHINLNL